MREESRAAGRHAVRGKEFDRLLDLLQRAGPASILISGEAGMGKTTLLDNALEDLDRPAVRLRYHQEHAAPYARIVDLMSEEAPIAADRSSTSTAYGVIDTVARIVCAGSSGRVLVIEDLHRASADALDLLPRLDERLAREGCGCPGRRTKGRISISTVPRSTRSS